MILPDGTLYKKQGGLYLINNTLENRHKILDTYPEWLLTAEPSRAEPSRAETRRDETRRDETRRDETRRDNRHATFCSLGGVQVKRLKEEYQALANVFSNHYEAVGCCCHHNPPCGYCTHPGHPENLAETPEAWVEMLEPMCEGQEQILLGDDTPALKRVSHGYTFYDVLQTSEAVAKCKEVYPHMRFRSEDKYIGLPIQCIERVFGGVV